MPVYFMEAAGRIKIGHTQYLRTRLATVRTACPVPVDLLAWVDGGRAVERALHQQFHADKLHGEWFADSPALRAVIAAAPYRGAAPSNGVEPRVEA